MSFYLVVTILLLNLVFAIIIDAFADIRNKHSKKEEDINDRCFICGISRVEFEIR